MKNNTEAAAKKHEELLNDLHALVVEAEKMTGDAPSEGVASAVNALRERFDSAQERLGELYNGARKQVIAGAKSADEAIRSNPYQSLAIAAGVGLLVGILVGGRRK
jgi:ElaB/YqjD/DUF883 family membrane-anchored ribosome-binding protein